MSAGAARPLRIDKHVAHQTIALIRVLHWLAVHGQRITNTHADGHHGEHIHADTRPEPGGIHQQRIDIIEHPARQAGRLCDHRPQVRGPVPMQERRERHNRIVDHMPTYRNAHRSGGGQSGRGDIGGTFAHQPRDGRHHILSRLIRPDRHLVPAGHHLAMRVHRSGHNRHPMNLDTNEGACVRTQHQRSLRASATIRTFPWRESLGQLA